MRPIAFSLVAMLGASPALATDLTAAGLWAEWRESARDAGQVLGFGGQQLGQGTVTLQDFSATMPVDDGKLSLDIATLRFVELGDGAVAVEPEGEMLVTFRETGSAGLAVIAIDREGFEMVARGDPETRSYRYAADSLTMTFDTLREEDGSDVPLDMTMTVTGLESESRRADGRETSDGSVAQLAWTVRAEDPDEELAFDMTYELSDLVGFASVPRAIWAETDDPDAIFRPGGEIDLRLSHGGGGALVNAITEDGPVEFDSSSAAGIVAIESGENRLAYDLVVEGWKLRSLSPFLPFPAEVSVEQLGMALALPMLADPQPRPFKLSLNLDGLSPAGRLWDLYDPEALLPRDPATFLLALSGIAILERDLSEETMQPPGEITEISLDGLQLSVAGAELLGEGAFDVDMRAPGLAPGAPQLVGSAAFQLSGAMALIDTLTQLGVLTPSDAFGARAGIGMFAVPGPAPDSFTAEFEIGPDGQVIANGLPLPPF